MPDPETTISGAEIVTVEIPFLAWTGRAALNIEVSASIDERWRLLAALEIAVKNGARLNGARLDGASLDDARLDGASLDGASLAGASLHCASLVGASLDRAKGIICAGYDPRGHRFLGVRCADQWYVAAGCRWFTIPQATAHWAKNKDALARVGVIQVAAGE